MRRFFVAGVPAAIVFALVALMATPAWAHTPVLSGSTVCTNGEHVVTWTIGNSETASGRSMSFTSITATIGAQSYPVTGYDAVVPPSGSTSATSIVPGPTTGTITLHVNTHWADNFDASGSTSVELISPCPGGSTTTSSTSTSTSTSIASPSTTAAPTTSTSIATVTTLGGTTTSIGGGTSTTIAGESTTTIGIEGTTIVGAGPSDTPTTLNVSGTSAGSLPFTGGSSGPALLALASLAAGGALLYTSKRRRS